MKRATKPTRRPRTLVQESEAAAVDHCDLSILTDTFGFIVRACQIQSFKGFYEALGDTGLTPGSYATLAIIGANPGVRQGFVAGLLGFREPNMVRLVKELSSAGMIVGKRLEHDKRATGLELTEQGATFMEGINQRVQELDQSYTKCLTANERSTLIKLLNKVFTQGPATDSAIEFHDS